MEKTIRITQAMRFEDIKALLNGETPAHSTTIEDANVFCDERIAALAKKNASTGEKKPTETQKQNEGYMAQILDILATAEDGMTCANIHRAMTYAEPYEVQKTASLLRKLGENGTKQVVSEKGKGGKTIFKLA